MGKPFSINLTRFNPYSTYRFLVYFGATQAPVAGVSKVGALVRSSEVIEYREGGNGIILKALGRMKYNPIKLERGVTYDKDFQAWADAAQVLDSGEPSTSLVKLRQDIRIELHNESGQPVLRYNVHRAWVSEYQALPDLDASANSIAIETITLQNEGWELDSSLTEQAEI